MAALRDCIDSCNLVDLGFMGSCFTWCRGKDPSTFIRERLDRFLASPSWLSLFPNAFVRHIPIYKSDHAPILLNSEGGKSELYDRIFRFESFWLSSEDCKKIVLKAWN